MADSYSAGGIVLNRVGQVLLVNQNGNSWSLPKGHIDPGEDAVAAAKREIREESGIQNITIQATLGSYERYQIGLDGQDNHAELKHITIFLCTTDELVLHPSDPTNPAARWVDITGVVDLLTHPTDKAFFEAQIPKINTFLAK